MTRGFRAYFLGVPASWLLVVSLGGCKNTDATSPRDSDGPEGDSASASDPDTGSGWISSVKDSFTEVGLDAVGVVPFKEDTVLEYHLIIDPSVYEEMEAHGDDEVYRVSSLEVRGGGLEEDYSRVGVRYKGDYSLHHCWDSGARRHDAECAKLSMRIKFNEYNEDGRFFGLKKINLHAMSEDETKLRERLAYSVFNEFGVETVRTAHAKLYINDAAPLLVLAVEQVDGRYTVYHYPEAGDGNLYKEIWPVASLDESTLLTHLRTNDDIEDGIDISHFIAFGNAVAATTEETFLAELADWVDVAALLRYMAVDRAIKNWDGITAFYWRDRPHNFYWYHDVGGSERFHLIPWDMDKTFWEFDPYMDLEENTATRPVPDWNVLPASCDPISVWYHSVWVFPPGCDHLINLLAVTGWDEFAALGRELLETGLRYDAMDEKVTAWAKQIAPLVDEDPLLDRSVWERDVEHFRDILQKSIEDFETHLTTGYIIEE
jgi:spore coat protein H